MTRFGEERSGLSALPDGRLLRDAVAEEPTAWLGPAHVAAFGGSSESPASSWTPTSACRSTSTPTRRSPGGTWRSTTARPRAWIVLDAPDGAGVGLGFAHTLTKPKVLAMVNERDSAGLLASLRRRTVRAGDTVLVPVGRRTPSTPA